MGHFCILNQSAFRKLDEWHSPWHKDASSKSKSNLPMPKMMNTDPHRFLKGPDIQRALQAPTKIHRRILKKNSVINLRFMLMLCLM